MPHFGQTPTARILFKDDLKVFVDPKCMTASQHHISVLRRDSESTNDGFDLDPALNMAVRTLDLIHVWDTESTHKHLKLTFRNLE